MEKHHFVNKNTFKLESGEELKQIEITYHTAGELNYDQSNVIWVCHALTANSNVTDWWPGMFGEGKLVDPSKHFIVCANILGSCYGTTGPLSLNPESKRPYFREFPLITVRDMVNAHELLRNHLKIERIHTVVGGSIGGQQALEWSIMHPKRINHLIFIASGFQSDPWLIAFNESQRMAIESDPSFFEDKLDGGLKGMETARSIALLSYRNAITYNSSQKESVQNKLSNFKASSYQRYQGEKLAQRFNAYSYYSLSKSVDSHNIARNRGDLKDVLQNIKVKCLLLGIDTDILFSAEEIKNAAKLIPEATYSEIKSIYGHDGFLLENEQLSERIKDFYNEYNN